MNKPIGFYPLAIVLLGTCAPGSTFPCIAGEPSAVDSLATRLAEHGPIFVGDGYKCADMVWAVNELRKLDKAETIRVLYEFAERTAFDENKPRRDSIFLVGRCLFEKPGEWPPLFFENPDDRGVPKSALRKLPLYPIALSKNVPFMLISCYYLGGDGGNPRQFIKECESLLMRKTDLSTHGFEEAAKAFVNSDVFAELYPEVELRKRMAEMVLNQAGRAAER